MSFMSWPMLSHDSLMFLKHCSACSAAPPATMAPVAGSMGSWAGEVVVVGERHRLGIQVAHGRLVGVAGHYQCSDRSLDPLSKVRISSDAKLCKCIKHDEKSRCQQKRLIATVSMGNCDDLDKWNFSEMLRSCM